MHSLKRWFFLFHFERYIERFRTSEREKVVVPAKKFLRYFLQKFFSYLVLRHPPDFRYYLFLTDIYYYSNDNNNRRRKGRRRLRHVPKHDCHARCPSSAHGSLSRGVYARMKRVPLRVSRCQLPRHTQCINGRDGDVQGTVTTRITVHSSSRGEERPTPRAYAY